MSGEQPDPTAGVRFVCAVCGDSFVGTSEAEANAEFEALFGRKMDPERDAKICDGCFERLGVADRVLG